MRRRVLIVVENNSVPFDRRVWGEARTLRNAGWEVAVISPKAIVYSEGGGRVPGENAAYEVLEGIHVFRYGVTAGTGGLVGFAREYTVAFLMTVWLTFKVWRRHGFDVLQVCNPPDFFFPLGWFCRWAGKAFVFDHHDLVPESIAERWSGWKATLLFRIALWAER